MYFIRLKFAVRRFARRITPLTWLLWLLLVSDLAAPGYLRFHLLIREIDLRVFVQDAMTHAGGNQNQL